MGHTSDILERRPLSFRLRHGAAARHFTAKRATDLMIEAADRIEALEEYNARLRLRLDNAAQQLSISDAYEADENGQRNVPSVWRLQNALIRDALRGGD